MSSPLLLQQCPAFLDRLTLIVFVMGGRWPYSCCFVGCSLHDLFNIARSILVYLASSFFSIRLVSVYVVHPYCSIDTTADWKKTAFTSEKFMKLSRRDVFNLAVNKLITRKTQNIFFNLITQHSGFRKYSIILKSLSQFYNLFHHQTEKNLME